MKEHRVPPDFAILKKTPFYTIHQKSSAKMVPFGEWNLPLNYKGVITEHHNVRENAGIFDVSHMGEFFIKGADAKTFLQKMTINDLDRLKIGQSQYSAMLTPTGCFVDDLLIYHTNENEYLLCVNAANIIKDFNWLNQHSADYKNLVLTNESSKWAQLAVQGPKSLSVLEGLKHICDFNIIKSLSYGSFYCFSHKQQQLLISRTGYTGEKGYELYINNTQASEIWFSLMTTSEITNVLPTGLGARDTLRLEACYLLYGQDINETITPLEAGISWATKLEKTSNFIGKKALLHQKETGLSRKLYAFQMIDLAIPRQGMPVYKNNEQIGVVTSGSVLPSLKSKGGLALLEMPNLKPSDIIFIGVRNKQKKATIVQKPLYKAKTKS